MLLWLSIYLTSAAVGPYLSVNPNYGSSVYLFRLLTLAALPFAVLAVGRMWPSMSPTARALCLTCCAFILWAPLSALWAPTDAKAGTALIAGALGLSAGLVVLSGLARPASFLRSLTPSWIVAFIVVAAAAFVERFMGVTFGGDADRIYMGYTLAAESTFGNPNNFAAFLLIVLSLLLSRVGASRGALGRVGNMALLLLCCLLLVWCQSRTGVLGGLLLVLIACVWLGRDVKRAVPGLLMGAGLIIGMLLVSPTSTDSITNGLSQQVDDAFPKGVELRQEYVRKNLTLLGLHYAADSALMGRGPGSFEVLARGNAGAISLDGISNSHDVFVQALAEYGIWFTFPMLGVFILPLRSSLSKRRGKRRTAEQLQVLTLCIALIAGGLVASSTFTTPWWWAGVGTLAAYSSVLERQRREKRSATAPSSTPVVRRHSSL